MLWFQAVMTVLDSRRCLPPMGGRNRHGGTNRPSIQPATESSIFAFPNASIVSSVLLKRELLPGRRCGSVPESDTPFSNGKGRFGRQALSASVPGDQDE